MMRRKRIKGEYLIIDSDVFYIKIELNKYWA